MKLEDYELENKPRIDWFDFTIYMVTFSAMAGLILFFMFAYAE